MHDFSDKEKKFLFTQLNQIAERANCKEITVRKILDKERGKRKTPLQKTVLSISQEFIEDFKQQ